MPAPGSEVADLGGEDGGSILAKQEHGRVIAVLFDLDAHGADEHVGLPGIAEPEKEGGTHGWRNGEREVHPVSSEKELAVILQDGAEVRIFGTEVVRWRATGVLEVWRGERLAAVFGEWQGWGLAEHMQRKPLAADN